MKNLKILFLLTFIPQLLLSQRPLTGRDTAIQGPQSFAIVVGISKYRYIQPLSFADKDAELFRDWLKSPAGGKLKEENIYCLLNEEASNANFWGKGFQWLKSKQLGQGDKLFIYLAGHGDAIDEDQYFFLGPDCKPDGDKNNYLVSGAIQLFNLKKKIANETAKGVDVIFIMDACRTNELPGGTPGQNFLNTAISQKKAGEIMMLATGAGQVSLEDASIGNGHGLFTWYLVDGLTGMADAGTTDRRISFSEIQSYVEKNVPSLALQRFRRKQEPYFCCTEFSEKVISYVDTSYLRQWLDIKKQLERKGGRNAIENYSFNLHTADTLLLETYNRFNSAIRSNKLTGTGSAEEYFAQLNRKFPNNPYTLDAASSLAVGFANIAQQKVNNYLGCSTNQSTREKQENFDAAINLEKAYAIFRDIDEDFANSIRNRIYLLKASGDYGPGGRNGGMEKAFEAAHAGRLHEPNGAYIHNKLAQLHFEAGNRDSALLYANEAVRLAPNWPCALTWLAKLKDEMQNQNQTRNIRSKNTGIKPGYNFAGGIVRSSPSFQSIPNSQVINASSNSGATVEAGGFYYFPLTTKFIFRPGISFHYQSTSIEFQRREAAGGPVITETLDQSEILAGLAGLFQYRLGSRPYIIAGPAIQYSIADMGNSSATFLIKKFNFLGSVGLGIDLDLKKMILSPEIRFTHGFSNLNKEGTVYNSSMSDLKRSSITAGFYFRRK